MKIKEYEIILYVADQQKSRNFYSSVLKLTPSLDVPGMTEFSLTDNFKLGLMPESGIAKILSDKMPDPRTGTGIPRCELYILSDEAESSYELALKNGAKEISRVQERNWGDKVGYVADQDGHIIAFAERMK